MSRLRMLFSFRIAVIMCCFCGLFNMAQGQAPSAGFNVTQTAGCIPFSVQFTNTSLNATSWYWDFGNGNFSTSQNPVNIYLGTGNFTVKLVAYNSMGQSDSLIQTGYIQTTAPPAVNFYTGTTVACLENSSVSFTNLSSGFDSCIWDFGDGVTSNILNPIHQYSTPGLYTVTLIAYNSGLGCSASLSKNGYITILSNPAASFTANATSLCGIQQPITFTASASSAISFNWQFGDGSISSQQSPSHQYTQPGIYSVTLVTTNQLGCSDTVVNSNYIEIRSNPVPIITSTGGLTQCLPLTTTFSAMDTSIVSWTWDFGDSTSSILANATHTYHISGDYVVNLSVTYSNGCVNSDTVHVHVFPLPYAAYLMTNYSGCAPLAVNFNNYSTGNITSYSWNFGDGSTSSQVSPVHNYLTAGNFTSSLHIVDINGCSKDFQSSATILVSQISAAFTADDWTGCEPHQVNFNFPGGGVYNYNWDFGDGGTSTQQSPSHTYSNTGNYNVTLTVSNASCSDTFTNPTPVQVTNGVNNFNPVTPVVACAPFTINLYDNSPGTSSWNWDFDDGAVATVNNPVHTFTAGGTYNVSLETQSSGTNCSQLVDPYGIYIIHGGEANFTLNQTICPPYTATFTDNSVNAVSWLWDFGDGTTSTQQNPVHVYGAPGSYNVSLTITTADGCVYTEFYNYAVTFLPLSSAPTAVTTDTILPLTVTFAANSAGATSWFWDFHDGNTSTLQNPVNIFTTPGPYSLTLILSNGVCTDTLEFAGVEFGTGTILPGYGTDSLHVPDPVYSCVPYEMNFNNPAFNTVAWYWDFGDGGTSNLENPEYIYTNPGVFTVTLITWDAAGVTDTIVQPAPFYLTGSSADFQLSFANNCAGSTVNTENNSVNAVSYLWDFGDGATSTLYEPTHIYSTIGINYIVSLTTTDSSGCTDFMARSYYAANVATMGASTRRACVGDTIYFDNGTMNFASYHWDFGDSTYSSIASPWHVYSDSGTYQISLTVTDSLGCVITHSLAYPISVSKPDAGFSYTINQNGCSALVIQFTNTSTGAESYVWNFGFGNFTSQTDPTFTFWNPGNHTVSLIATSEGCVDTHTVNNIAFVPNVQPNFSYVQSSECFPITITCTDSSHDAVSWLWDFGDGTTSTLQNPIHVFTSMPIGTIKLIATDIMGCWRMVSKPNIEAMVIAVGTSDTSGCSPFAINIADSSVNVNSWLWNFGDGSTSSLEEPTHIFASNGIYNVSLTATASSGCTQVINPVVQVEATGPEAQFSLNSIVSCAPTIVNFDNNSIGATQSVWNFGDANQSILDNPVHIYNQPGTYDVSLVVMDDNGCADTLISPGIVHITGSVANFEVGTSNGCSPWQVQFQDSSISAFSWVWNFGDGTISTQQNPIHVYNTPGNYVVTLMTQDTTGCQSVFSNPVPLQVQQPPSSLFTMSDTTGCAPFTIIMNNLTGAGNYSYQWNFGDNTTSTAKHPTHVFNNPGTYFVTLIATNASGCSDTVVASVPVVVADVPAPSFTVNVNSGCDPLPVQFNNTSTNIDSTTVFTWNFGNGIISHSDEPYFIYQQAGLYSVTLTATNGGVCQRANVMNNLIVVSDGTPPPPVALKSVSVTSGTSVDVTWGNLAITDLAAYKIYRYNRAISYWELVFADNNPNNTSWNATTTFTDSVPGTADVTYTYVVQAINSCGNETLFELHVPHTTINLRDTILNNTVKLEWNLYSGCTTGAYEIYRQDNGNGNFNLISTVDENQSFYFDSTVYCGMLVSYRIKAINLCGEGFESWSDIESVSAPGVLLNQVVDVIRSTVVDDSYVFTEWAPPVLAPQLVTEFEIYRSTDEINFTLLATVSASETNYSDYDTDVHTNHYMYRVKVKNICELQTTQGLPGTSILLQGQIDTENKSVLRWSAYKDWDTGVDYYVIEKQDLNGTWQTVRMVDGNILDYIDR